ncbi:MAG: hypothetical protein PHV71_06085 [Eubacteriales bacterium]|nr:hypothetical protein [Eubacteriales bacterium]MDD3200249.1 hypothetical protein [Eubacteriales bacterium]MDD4630141.1 hypothetical protein [Eubacteriales bacterium]
MSNLLKKLRKENNENDKLLSKENDQLMTNMVVYLRHSNLCDYDIEVIRRELFGMVYEAQLRGESSDMVIGENYKGFCEELMNSGRQKSFYEKFLQVAYIIIVGTGALFAIELIFSGFLLELFVHGNIYMSISIGLLVSTALMIAGSLAVYWFITKYAFELSGKGLTRYELFFIIGFAIYFTGLIIIKFFLDDIRLFEINVFIPLIIFASSYLLVKMLGERITDRIAGSRN